jgi:formylmethanofuran dehydrogenase subunit A
VTIYTPGDDIERMFELPRYVVKGGRIVVENGEVRQSVDGTTLHVRPSFDEGAVPLIRDWFQSRYTVQFNNYSVEEEELGSQTEVSTIPARV